MALLGVVDRRGQSKNTILYHVYRISPKFYIVSINFEVLGIKCCKLYLSIELHSINGYLKIISNITLT